LGGSNSAPELGKKLGKKLGSPVEGLRGIMGILGT
jgi:hypothetical protein